MNELHDSYDQPPNVPLIMEIVPKQLKKESISEVMASAATAFAKAVRPLTPTTAINESSGGFSPRKTADARMKNLSNSDTCSNF